RDEFRLAPSRGGPAFGHDSPIRTVRLEQPRFLIIGQRDCQQFANEPFPQVPVLNRADQFDATKEIPRHPIGAAEKDLRLAPVFKTKNAAVLEKPIDNAAHGYVFAYSLDIGAQTANPAD